MSREETQQRIGKLLVGTEERDAIHIAVMPLIAAEKLTAGEHVGLTKNGQAHTQYQPFIGIVDPYLTETVEPGRTFYVFMYPNTVTGLRHHWQHPAFADHIEVNEGLAKAWLQQFAAKWEFDFDHMIAVAADPDSEGRWGAYITAYGHDLHSAGELGADHELFWHYMSVLTGKTFSPEHRERIAWGCTC